MSNNTAQGVYSPLPQSISDTDSEEELHSSIPAQSMIKDTSKHLNGNDLRDYHHIVDDMEDNHLNGFPNINSNMLDDTPMIKDSYRKPMSPIRKTLFVVSILVCFLTIFIFLWILPCSEDSTCPRIKPVIRTSSWEKPYHGIELMGPINVAKGNKGHSKNLIFLFRGDVINANPVQGLQNIPPKGGGAISIMGDTGKVAWYVPSQRLPSDIDCTLLDVDQDGDNDCIMSGADGLLQVINPILGTIHWSIHVVNSPNSRITSIDFPKLISDVNSDHVNDLLTSAALNNTTHNNLIVISGRAGNILGRPYIVRDCEQVHGIEIEKSYVSFSCKNGTDLKKSFIALHDFYVHVFNDNKIVVHTQIIKQHAKLELRNNQRMIYSVNGRQLIVNNQGKCPGNCSVTVKLIDQRINQAGNVTWFYNGTNIYGMVPTSLTFKNSQNNLNSLQGHINGFILKFWQWFDIKPDKSYIKDHFHYLFHDITKLKLPWHYPMTRIKRNIAQNNTTIREQMLTERIVLITFNSTNINIVNASQSDVKQLCTHDICQPDLSYQQNSVLVADLDDDGSKELISYLSTYMNSDEYDTNNNMKYQLQSSVKVIRLESELPKLYEAVTKY